MPENISAANLLSTRISHDNFHVTNVIRGQMMDMCLMCLLTLIAPFNCKLNTQNNYIVFIYLDLISEELFTFVLLIHVCTYKQFHAYQISLFCTTFKMFLLRYAPRMAPYSWTWNAAPSCSSEWLDCRQSRPMKFPGWWGSTSLFNRRAQGRWATIRGQFKYFMCK